MSDQIYAGTAQYNLIYIFAIHDDEHEGYLKIGEHSFSSASSYRQLPANCDELNANAHNRIRQYTRTALTRYELLYTELARTQVRLADGTIESAAFSDHDVHEVLDRSGFDVHRFYDTDRDSEWYKVKLPQAIAAIKAVKEGRNVLTAAEIDNSQQYSVAETSSVALFKRPTITLRAEQKECVNKTKRVFANSDRMLWDCKMRFGKTVTAYSLVKEMNYKKVIVVTHRPAVVDGWRTDFELIFGGEDRVFITKSNMMYEDRFTSEDVGIDAENDRKLTNLSESGKPFVYFASMQDLRGSKAVEGKYDKNRAVFAMDWDLIIYDEAHEGTQTELGLNVQEKLEETKQGKTPKKVLQLSGTPYNLLNQYADDNVYSWDYVMEQRSKQEWDDKHPGDHNPYADLPELRICTFDLRNKIPTSYRYEDENIAFNFREFFRVWTGDAQKDFRQIPSGAKIGDFVHEEDIIQFLNLITTDSGDSNYPFASQEYRDMFRHTFWILPGVKEARAFSKLLKEHDVFGKYEVVNVAGEGDVEQPYDDALKAVRKAIKNSDYTITLSCGKLTTGVTVNEWTGVMLLSGSSSTGAAGYMQTIFRVQSAGSINGMQKKVCYAFDFAPDRALKVISDVHKLKKSAVGTDDAGRVQLGEFLNFCPVLAEGETGMEFYDVPKMMRQLKKLTVDAAIKSGFDDDSIYKADAGIVFDNKQAQLIDLLRNRLTPQKKGKRDTHVKVNDQGLTDEQYRKAQEAKRKRQKDRTPEEIAALEKEREMKKKQQALFDLLRNISIRLPLLIYGTATDFNDSIKLEEFIDIVDDASWQEFMPKEVDKTLFRKLLVFYDEDVIEGAGMRIRHLAKAADELPPTQRVLRIAEIFSYFRNPAKETVLTPWRVVNMHMGDTVGGYNFYKERYPEGEGLLDEPRLIDNGQVTEDLFLNENVKVLEMNSKSGLYPLYVAYSIYRILLSGNEENHDIEELQAVWDKVIQDHLFVLCQTTMAVSITKRTLAGYRNVNISAVYLTKLLERMKDQDRLARKLTNPATWGKEGERMKFDAIVGNPPYQVMDGGNKNSSMPVYQHFVMQAKKIQPGYISMIMPARWFIGGKGLDDFRKDMLKDNYIESIYDYADFHDVFPTVDLAGGVCYFLWNSKHEGESLVNNVSKDGCVSMKRSIGEFDILVRDNNAIGILRKILSMTHNLHSLSSRVSPRKPFGLSTDYKPLENGIPCHFTQKIGFKFASENDVVDSLNILGKWKFLIPRAPIAGQTDFTKAVGFYYNGNTKIAKPGECCTEMWIVAGAFDTEEECQSFKSYILTKIVRFLLLQSVISQDVTRDNFRFVPDLGKYSGRYSDKQLCEVWGITEEEWTYIDSRIHNYEGQS